MRNNLRRSGKGKLGISLVVTSAPQGSDVNEFDGQWQSASVETVFQAPGRSRLALDTSVCSQQVADYLAHKVARTPGDLRSHVQRVVVHINLKDAEGTYGALLDLFIVLVDKGRALRGRMLEAAKTLLNQERSQVLSQGLDGGVSATDALPLAVNSVLSKGFTGSSRLVERLGAAAQGQRDPLDEARECLEYGQLQQAQQVLEEAILQGPQRDELHHELLEIYKHARDVEGFRAMWRRLEDAGTPASAAWQRLEEFLGRDL